MCKGRWLSLRCGGSLDLAEMVMTEGWFLFQHIHQLGVVHLEKHAVQCTMYASILNAGHNMIS